MHCATDHKGLVVCAVAAVCRQWPALPGMDRDDLIQEGMVALMRAQTSYDARQGLAWSTYATLRIRKHLTRIASRAARSRQAERASRPVASDPGPLGAAIASEEREALQTALARLPQRERQVIERRALDGWGWRAIAEEMRLSRRRLQQIYHAGLVRLRSYLEVHCG